VFLQHSSNRRNASVKSTVFAINLFTPRPSGQNPTPALAKAQGQFVLSSLAQKLSGLIGRRIHDFKQAPWAIGYCPAPFNDKAIKTSSERRFNI